VCLRFLTCIEFKFYCEAIEIEEVLNMAQYQGNVIYWLSDTFKF